MRTERQALRSLARLRQLVQTVDDPQVRQRLGTELADVAAEASRLARAHRALTVTTGRLTQLTRRDAATGLYNQRYFFERLHGEFRRAWRYRRQFSLCMIDLDDFKRVNDAHGHAAGDQVLRWVATTIRRITRETDLAARYGGDEFVVLLPETAGDQALCLAERIRAAVLTSPGGLTVSIGMATTEDGISSPRELLLHADRALYRAKALGKNQIMKGTTLACSIGNSSIV